MTSKPAMPERLTSEERRSAARRDRKRWADEVKQALAEKGLSVHAAARLAGISPGALQAWLNQDVEPAPRAMASLASVIERRHLYLLDLLGWLPEELSQVPLRLEASARLQESLAEMRRWVAAATTVTGSNGAILIANALLERSGRWEVILRRSYRGRRYQAYPYGTHIALSRLGDPDPHAAPKVPRDTDADRTEIESVIGDELRRANADWRPPERASDWNWVKRSDLVLSVPLLTAAKPRGLRQNLAVPPSICVVGIPFAGGPDVGALLASTLDWAFTDLNAAARERFDVRRGSAEERLAQAEIAQHLLDNPAGSGSGRLLVWSYNAVPPIIDTFRGLRNDLPLVIFLKAPDSLVRYAAQQLGETSDIVQLETAQNTVKHVLAGRDAHTHLTLDVPELPVESGAFHDSDAFFDAHVELAFKAAEWLHKEHGGAPLDDAPGVLGDLWRQPGPSKP
jgi:hypothetical protein